MLEFCIYLAMAYCRSSHPEVFSSVGVVEICSKFTGEHPCRSVISIKWFYWNFIEFALRHGCSPVNLLHIFRTPFPRSTSGWLLRWWYNWGRNTVDIILILLLNFLTDKLFNRQNILIDKQFSHLGNTCYNFGTHWSKKQLMQTDTFYLLKITLFISQPRFNTNLQPKKLRWLVDRKSCTLKVESWTII